MLTVFIVLLVIFSARILAQLVDLPTEDCDLKWQGSWYLSERSTPVVINATWVDSLGRCVAMSQHDHHYLFHLNSAIGSCYRCVAFFPVHKNVLQFKKTGCMRSIINDKNIAAACRRSFRGDAPMTTLFRVNASSERCPFEAPLNFTYLVTDGPCTSRTSTVTVCANPHRYRFQYQACPEIAHTETHAEHIECIAKWNSFGIEYFSAKITNGITPNPSSRFRCIIHERASSGGRMGISADASCNELTDISFANTILKYKQDTPVISRCRFPSFLIHDHNSDTPRLWKSIVTEFVHQFNNDEWIEQWHRQNKSVSICIDEENLGIAHKFIVHAVNGCTSGYQCVKIIKRKKNIIDVIRSKMCSSEFEACEHIIPETIETLLLEGHDVEKCPVKGRHSRSDCPMSSVRIGCPHEHSIQLRPYCNSNRTHELVCRGHWTENDVHYMIAEESDTKKRVCYMYSLLANGAARIRSYRHLACHPQVLQHSAPQYDFNASEFEHCEPTTSAWESNEAPTIFVASYMIFMMLSLWQSLRNVHHAIYAFM